MVRQYTIYPNGGWTLAAPFVADPLMVVPFVVSLPVFDKFGNPTTRDVSIGVSWDDNVQGGGGLATELENNLEEMWRWVKQDFYDRRVANTAPAIGIDHVFIQSGYTPVLNSKPLALIELQIITPPSPIDYWYATNDFAKYGFVCPMGVTGAPRTQQWWNFPHQEFGFEIQSAAYNVFLNLLGATAFLTAYEVAVPPNITFTGFSGLQGFYNDDGLTFT